MIKYGHSLIKATQYSNFHYICTKCNVCFYQYTTGEWVAVNFPHDKALDGSFIIGAEKLTCDEIIIKQIIE